MNDWGYIQGIGGKFGGHEPSPIGWACTCDCGCVGDGLLDCADGGLETIGWSLCRVSGALSCCRCLLLLFTTACKGDLDLDRSGEVCIVPLVLIFRLPGPLPLICEQQYQQHTIFTDYSILSRQFNQKYRPTETRKNVG